MKGDDSSFDDGSYGKDDYGGDYGDYGAEMGLDKLADIYGGDGSDDGDDLGNEDVNDDTLLLRGVTPCHFDPDHEDQVHTPRQTLINAMQESIRAIGQNTIGMILDGQEFEEEEREAIESCFV